MDDSISSSENINSKYRLHPVSTRGKWEMTQPSIIQPAITFWYFPLSQNSCCVSSFLTRILANRRYLLEFPSIPESARTGLIDNSAWIYHSNKFRRFSLSVCCSVTLRSEIEILDAVRAQPACELTLDKVIREIVMQIDKSNSSLWRQYIHISSVISCLNIGICDSITEQMKLYT